MKKTAYSYIRFSTKKQEFGTSKIRQTEITIAFCERHNLALSPLTYHDLGVSGWKGKNFHEGALGAFLSAVQQGRVRKGSVLVVESLDRISRQAARKALRIVEQIIEAGVTVATISPERFYDSKSLDDPFSLIEMLFVFVRANEESELKSKRVRAAWNNKRAKAAKGEAMAGKCPAWLMLVDGKYRIDEKKSEAVRQIVRLSADGRGAPSILDYLHKNKIPNPATGQPIWSQAYVQLLMRDRRLVGEFQPCEYRDGKRVPIGPPIENYYPAIIDTPTFARAQAAVTARARNNVTKQGSTINLFAGLIVEPVSGGKWIVGKKAAGKPPRLQLLAARNKQCKSLSVDYNEVEAAVLSWLDGLDLERLLPEAASERDVEGQLADIENRIAAMSARFQTDDIETFGLLGNALKNLEDRRSELKAQLNEQSSLSHSVGNMHEVIDAMRAAKGEERRGLRLQLRAHLASVIERIELRAVEYWKWSIGVLDIVLTDGTVRREVTHKHLLPVEKRNELLFEGMEPATVEKLRKYGGDKLDLARSVWMPWPLLLEAKDEPEAAKPKRKPK